MGYVVADVVRNLWSVYGRPASNEWREVAEAFGLTVRLRDLPAFARPGLVKGRTIYLQFDLPNREMALTAFHEIGHVALHDGDVRWWHSRPQGHITVSRMERQAEEFALLFPDWDKEYTNGISTSRAGEENLGSRLG